MTLQEKIDRLVELEQANFHAVKNEGGQASCQRDDMTFYIMRSSQFSAWSEEMIDSYRSDLLQAEIDGRNLLAEKYAWMERETAPKKFEEIRHLLRTPSPETEDMIERITKQQVVWMEEYAARYPYVSAGNRYIHAKDAPPWETSFETYTRGELHTYSERTIVLYMAHTQRLQAGGRNMVMEVMQATVKQYGYADLDEAERVTEEHRR